MPLVPSSRVERSYHTHNAPNALLKPTLVENTAMKQQRRMARTKLAQDFCQLLNSPNSPNLHWNSTSQLGNDC